MYFDWRNILKLNISQIFKIQSLKHILKHVTSKFIVQKQQFYEQFETFFKTKYINGFKMFIGTYMYKLCPKNSLRPSIIKNTQNIFKIVQKWPFLTFAVLVANFWNKNDWKLDKNPRNFFLLEVTISNSFRDIDV